MRTLGSGARRPALTGGFLPPVFQPFERDGIRVRRGTVSMIAGCSGAMKTGLALVWLYRLNLPTLYISADSEDFEMQERAASMVSGHPQARVRQNIRDYVAQLDSLPFRVVYEDSPSYKDLEQEVAAYAEAYGQFPEVIVIDNFMNLVGENENEWASMRDHSKVVHRLTRTTGAATFVLHHMGEDKADQSMPQPKAKLQGKVSQLPKVILSLAYDNNELRVAPVKNRFGPGDASGQRYTSLWFDPSTMQVYPTQYDFQQARSA